MSAYISIVANKLQGNLPAIVTKEELMNFYLHDIKAKGGMDTNVTVINLVQAANLVNIKVKGKSRLEIIVPLKEQWKYLMENVNATTNRKSIKEKLMLNKNDIIAAYEEGESIKGLAESWCVAQATMRRFLIEVGAKLRKANEKVLKTYVKSSVKKKGRRKRAK